MPMPRARLAAKSSEVGGESTQPSASQAPFIQTWRIRGSAGMGWGWLGRVVAHPGGSYLHGGPSFGQAQLSGQAARHLVLQHVGVAVPAPHRHGDVHAGGHGIQPPLLPRQSTVSSGVLAVGSPTLAHSTAPRTFTAISSSPGLRRNRLPSFKG